MRQWCLCIVMCLVCIYSSIYFLGSNDIFGCYLICLVFSTIVVKHAINVLLKKMQMCIILLVILNLPVFSAAKI